MLQIYLTSTLDKFSRRRAIYALDFTSGAIYTIYALLMWRGWFSFSVLAIGTVLLGSIDGIYRVSYDSFYPLLITEGNYQKAYSVASMLETMTAFVLPLSAFLYNTIGMLPLLIINAASYLIAATLETQIWQAEEYAQTRKDENYDIKCYTEDFKDGMAYLNQETGLKAVVTYFSFNALQWGLMDVLVLPYFKANFANGEYLYIVVGGCAILGRLLGGGVYYKFRMPTQHKFTIALVVYVCISLIGGFYLFFPLVMMCIMEFIEGLMGVTSYNIRISATQSYVPDERKGRFNGTFEMLATAGNTLGQVMAGTLSLFIGERVILGTFGVLTALCAVIVIGGNRKAVATIYNREA